MKEDINDLMKSIKGLPETDKSKLLTFLMYETSAISTRDRETVEFLMASSERLKKWISESDKLIKDTDLFINEIKGSIQK